MLSSCGSDGSHNPRLHIVGFVSSDLLVDFGAMSAGVCPCVDEIFGAQGRVRAQDLRVTQAGTACLVEEPHGYARSHDDRIAPTNTRNAFDAREGVAEVA